MWFFLEKCYIFSAYFYLVLTLDYMLCVLPEVWQPFLTAGDNSPNNCDVVVVFCNYGMWFCYPRGLILVGIGGVDLQALTR